MFFNLSMSAVLLLSGLELVAGDAAVLCSLGENSRFGDITWYEQCDGQCDCSIFNLICLKRSSDGVFTIHSESFEYSDTCAASECICNTSADWETISARITDDKVALPSRVDLAIPDYSVLLASSQETSIDTAYARGLFNWLSSSSIIDYTIKHEMNENKPAPLPDYYQDSERNSGITWYDQNCAANIECDLQYDANWDHRMTVAYTCE